MNKTIARNTTILSIGTNVSRVLGLVRDMLIASSFGTTYEAAAFVVAFTLPNMLRDFVGEGAANAAFVPVLTEYKVKASKEEFWKTSNVILNILLLVLIAISILGVLGAPLLTRLIAPGLIKAQGAMPITIQLTRIMFPYILFMGLTAYGMGLLNTLGNFMVPALGQGFLNIAIIACILLLRPKFGVMSLAIGVLLGGLLQVLVQIPVLRKNGFRFMKVFEPSHPAVKKIGALLAPRILGTAVYQINVLVDRILASLFWIVGEGGIPALYYSYRLIQYPIAIFSTALATAALPVMSSHAVQNDMEKLKKTLSFSLRSVFFVMIPASVGLAVLGKPLVTIIFQRGLFTAHSTDITYQALLFYAIGLFAYGGIRILAICFYSINDTLTPVKVAACSLIVNIVFNLILMWPLKIGGLALATSIAAIFNFTALFILLRKRLQGFEETRLFKAVAKISVASLCMGSVCYFMSDTLLKGLGEMSLLISVSHLFLIVLTGMVIFTAATFILKMDESKKLLKWISKRS